MSIDFFKARALSEFDIGKKYREYVINDAWRSNDALWNLISSFAGEASSKIYERIVDLTKNIADVDVCDVKHLESISYQFGIKSGYQFIDSLPSEVYDMMNVLSVKESYFFRKNGIFSESGIDDIMSYIPDAISEIADSSNLYEAMRQALFQTMLDMFAKHVIDNAQYNAISSAVGSARSLTAGLEVVLNNSSITPEIYNQIKSTVISKLIDSGKISYDDYKSYEIHGNTLKDVYNINIIPAVEFTQVISDGSLITEYTVNHKIKFGNSTELRNYKQNGGDRFSVQMWNVSKSLVEDTISDIGISESVLNYIITDKMTAEQKTFIQAMEAGLVDGTISEEDFEKINYAISTISVLLAFEDYYSTDKNETLDHMVSDGVISSDDRDSFEAKADSEGFINTAKEFSSYGKFKLNGNSIVWMTGKVSHLSIYGGNSEYYDEKTFQKLPNNSNSIIVFNDDKWMIFKNLLSRYPSLEAVENKKVKPSGLVIFREGSDTLQLPMENLSNWNSIIGVAVKFNKVPYYVGVQTYINQMVYQSYYDLIKEKLNCVLNAGNEEDIDLYREDFLKYVSESGFNQYVNDRNVNFGFYRAVAFSHFCSNLYSKKTLIGDWFLDCDLHSNDIDKIDSDEVISEVAKALSDMTLAVAIRREIIKKLAIQYSYIGSNYSIEKTIGDFVLRNFTERGIDWNFRSNVATVNDDMLPNLSDIRNRFSLDVVEYYDNTEYLNISAESAKISAYAGKGVRKKIGSSINASGNLVTHEISIPYDIYVETEIPMISGGNEPFWLMPDYSVRILNQAEDVIEFYRNVDGSMETLTSIGEISSMAVKMWQDCALSSLINENLEMHNKYIGDGTGYMTAVNAGNENYPTIAPLPTITDLTESYGNMERDYQSVVNDDRPAIVEGIGVFIAGSYQYVPVTGEFIGTEREIFGIPPYLSYPINDYIRTQVDVEIELSSYQVPSSIVLENRVSSINTYTVSGYNTVLTTQVTQEVSSFEVETEVIETKYYAYLNGSLVIGPQYSEIFEMDGLYYTVNGNVSSPGIEMHLDQVTVSYDETVGGPNQNLYIDQIQQSYNYYYDNEEFTNNPDEVSSLFVDKKYQYEFSEDQTEAMPILHFYHNMGLTGLGPYDYDVKVSIDGSVKNGIFICEGNGDPEDYGYPPPYVGQTSNGYVWYNSGRQIIDDHIGNQITNYDNQLLATIPSGKVFSIFGTGNGPGGGRFEITGTVSVNGSGEVIDRSVIDEIYLEYHKNRTVEKIGELSTAYPITNTQTYDIYTSIGPVNPDDAESEMIPPVIDNMVLIGYEGQDEYGDPLPVTATVGDVVTSIIPEYLEAIRISYPQSDYNNIVNYTSAIINGNISSVVYQIDNGNEELSGIQIDASAGYFMVTEYFSILKDLDSNYNKYLRDVIGIRDQFISSYNIITNLSGPTYTTEDNYDRYVSAVNFAIQKSHELEDAVSAYDHGAQTIEHQYPISSFSDNFLRQLFGSSYDGIDKEDNRIDLLVSAIDETSIVMEPSSVIINVSSEVPVSEYYEYQEDETVWNTEYEISNYMTDVEQTIEHYVSTEITSYMEMRSDEIGVAQDQTPYLFDIYGGVINSWRNVNVELKGYQTNYEASPNLTKSYVENRYVDVDGPWIGDALYDLIYEMISISGSADSQIEPDPSNVDINKFLGEHTFDYSKINKQYKWYLPEYIDYIGGCNISKQLKVYMDEIIRCRNKMVFEVEVDSFNNQYTLYKDKSSQLNSPYDEEGVLWMRHNNFPFSFPIMEKPRNGWEDNRNTNRPSRIITDIGAYDRSANEDISAGYAWRALLNSSTGYTVIYTSSQYPMVRDICFNNARNKVATILETDLDTTYEAAGEKIDQIYIGYTMNYYRSIFNRCLAFGVNNTSLWAAGYDGKNSDESDHFNIRILQCKYFDINNDRYYGNRNPRSMNKFNSDPEGYGSSTSIQNSVNDQYRWLDFCGGYYDGNVINFVFYGPSGFRFRVYNLSNARLNNSDIIAEFNTNFSVAEEYEPHINGNHNPFRLVEDNYYCYIGWVTQKDNKKKLVVCQNDKKNYTFQSILAWDFPSEEESDEIDSLVAGMDMVKVKLKSGNVYYGRLAGENFLSNEGYEELYPVNNVKMNYIASSVDDDNPNGNGIPLPVIPIKDITQWRHWSYSLTENSLNTINYDNSLNVSATTSSYFGKDGQRLGMYSKMLYIPGNLMDQSIIAYDPHSGVWFNENLDITFDVTTGKYVHEDGTEVNLAELTQGIDYELTGYEIGKEFYELTPYLQQVIVPYGPSFAKNRFVPTDSEINALSACSVSATELTDGYYGLPYNNLYVERTDLDSNLKSLINELQPRSEYNFLVLKNFYNYNYEHEYSWDPRVSIDDEEKITGWRKYNKCSISRYSDSMWMSYNFIRDWNVLNFTNKQRQVARIMNDYEFVEVVYGTIQLMNTNYCKSNVFSIRINNSGLNKKVYPDDTEENAKMRENVKNQIKEEVRSMISEYAPIHTQLWKIEFKN